MKHLLKKKKKKSPGSTVISTNELVIEHRNLKWHGYLKQPWKMIFNKHKGCNYFSIKILIKEKWFGYRKAHNCTTSSHNIYCIIFSQINVMDFAIMLI